MKTKHTEGDWFASGTEVVSMPSQCKISNNISGWSVEQAIANAKLVATAPKMAELLSSTYIHLLNHMPSKIRNSAEGQDLLMSMRDTLCVAHGLENEEVQVWHEEQALNTKYSQSN